MVPYCRLCMSFGTVFTLVEILAKNHFHVACSTMTSVSALGLCGAADCRCFLPLHLIVSILLCVCLVLKRVRSVAACYFSLVRTTRCPCLELSDVVDSEETLHTCVQKWDNG